MALYGQGQDFGPRDWYDQYAGLGFGLGRRNRLRRLQRGLNFRVQPPVRTLPSMRTLPPDNMAPEPMMPMRGVNAYGSAFGVHRNSKTYGGPPANPPQYIEGPWDPIGTNWGMPLYAGQRATGEYMGGGERGWYTPPSGMSAEDYYGGGLVPATHSVRNPAWTRPPLNPRAVVGRGAGGRNIYAGAF